MVYVFYNIIKIATLTEQSTLTISTFNSAQRSKAKVHRAQTVPSQSR